MIYLDNAATTYPKPPAVSAAWERTLREAGGNPGRSGHPLSMRAAEVVFRAREAVASLFGEDAPERVVFTYNATYALNLAIHALVRPGDHVLLSNLEHNAVYRPIYALAAAGVIRFDLFDAVGTTEEVVARVAAKLRKNTRLVVTLHRSNVCGITLPIAAIGKLLASRGIRYLVDASQSAGVLQIRPSAMGITALCAPGHKALYGPTGTGFVLFSALAPPAEQLTPLLYGGTGTRSTDGVMPPFLPERLEAGTLSAPQLAALTAGIEAVQSLGTDEILREETVLYRYALARLAKLPHVTTFAADAPRGGAVLFGVRDMPSDAVADALSARGICVRGGFHCAPLAHQRLGTGETGAVRASFGIYNTKSDVDALCAALQTL